MIRDRHTDTIPLAAAHPRGEAAAHVPFWFEESEKMSLPAHRSLSVGVTRVDNFLEDFDQFFECSDCPQAGSGSAGIAR